MPAKKIPSDKELEQLLRMGMSLVEISEYYLEKHNIEITPSAISLWRKRRGLDPLSHRAGTDLIPWALRDADRQRHPANMLRAEARRRRGDTLSPKTAAALDNWLARRAETDSVVHYDPDRFESGFVYVARRPGIDLDLVRVPDKQTARPISA